MSMDEEGVAAGSSDFSDAASTATAALGSWSYVIDFCNVTTIAVCIICKVPQILAILKSKSVEGVSLQSVMVELLGYTIVLGYNVVKEYPYSAFLEYVFLVIQDMVLLLMLFYYVGALSITQFGYLGAFISLFYGFTQGIPHPSVLPVLIQFVTPISASSKLIQLKEIWSKKNSESVSVLTWLIAAYTCVSRILTTILQTGDVPLLVNYTIALILNSLIISSAIYFRKPKAGPSSSNAKEEKIIKNLPETPTENEKAKTKEDKKEQ